LHYLAALRLFRQGKGLKEPTVESDKILVNQFVAGLNVLVEHQAEYRADPVAAVKGETPVVGNQHQERGERQGLVK
jgi:hypothetical protein